MQISFRADFPKEIAPKYKTENSQKNTVAILGSSVTSDDILNYMDICSNSAKAIVKSGKNIVTGCSTLGIMGSAYNSGKLYSKKDENNKPEQNLVILTDPLWGDEDLENCIPVVCTDSEIERTEKFAQVADTILIFPGGTGTMQEISTFVFKNYYGKPEDKKKIILVGKDFFKGIIDQYQKLYETKLIKCPPEELFSVAENEEEINQIINKTL